MPPHYDGGTAYCTNYTVLTRTRPRFKPTHAATRNRMAMNEKAKGNECYKAGEPEEAMVFYSRALACLDDRHEETPKCWANRAMAALKLGLLEKAGEAKGAWQTHAAPTGHCPRHHHGRPRHEPPQHEPPPTTTNAATAENDCTKALELDPSYDKARLRRGMTRHRRGRYRGAIEDFEAMLTADPSRQDVKALLDRSHQKLVETEGDRLGEGEGGDAGDAVRAKKTIKISKVSVTAGAPPPLEMEGLVRKPFTTAAQRAEERAKNTNFTRVAIIDDDSSEEEEEEEEETKSAGFSRIAIQDDESEEDEEDEEGDMVDVPINKSGGSGSRIAIEEEESEEEEDVPINTSSGSSVPIEDEGEEAMSEWEVQQLKEKGVALCMASKYEEATPVFETALQGLEAAAKASKKPVDDSTLWAPLRNNLAACALATSDWETVVMHCDAVLERQPDVYKALLRRSEALERMGKFQAAMRDVKACLQKTPADHELKARMENLQRAGASAAASSVVDKTESEAAKDRGNQAMKEGAPAKALAEYTASLTANSSNVAARNNRALCFLKLGRWAEAEADATLVLEAEPNNPKGLFRRASARKELALQTRSPSPELLAAAIIDVKSALDLEPTNKRTQALLDELTAMANVPPPSDEQLNKQATPMPPAPPTDGAAAAVAAKQRGNAAMGAGDMETALREYTAAVAADPGGAAAQAALNNRAACYMKLGRWGEADEDASAVLEVEPNNVKALMRRGTARIEIGTLASVKSARADIERVTRIAPDDASAAMALLDCDGKIYELENPPPAASEGGVVDEGERYRIPVEDEDEEDDEEPVVEDVVRPQGQGTRVMIEEDESEDEAAEDAAAASGGQGTRVMIQDEDEEEDEPETAVPAPLTNPEASEAAKVLGNEALTAKDFAAAEAHYTEAIRLNPLNLAAYNNRALVMIKTKRWAEARADTTAVIDAPGTSANAALKLKATFRRAQAYEAEGTRGGLAMAAADLRALLKAEPSNVAAQKLLTKLSSGLAAPAGSKAAAEPPAPAAAAAPASPSKPLVQEVAGGVGATAELEVEKASLAQPDSPRKVAKAQAPRVIKAAKKVKIPKVAPKAMYELERVWRDIKHDSGLVAQYLKLFKATTFKKVFNESTNPDILPSFFVAVSEHLAADDPTAAARVLKSIAKRDGFAMTRMLLTEADKGHVASACAALPAELAADAAAIRTAYEC